MISPVNGTTVGSGASSVTTLAIPYSPVAGNTIVIFLATNGGVTNLTVSDNNNVQMTAGPTAVSGGRNLASFVAQSVEAGVTGYTANWTTGRIMDAVLEEYSGNTGINTALAGNSTTGSSASSSITCTLDDANDFLVVGMVATTALTGTVGNTRQNGSAGSATIRTLLMDNTSAVAGSTTCTATLTSGIWACLAIELRISSSLFSPPAITSEFHWGGGDGW